LNLPLAADPTTNGELATAFLAAREGHDVCRATITIIKDQYGY
jgi:hypothetical protein